MTTEVNASESSAATAGAGTIVIGFDGGQSGLDAVAFGMRWCRSTGDSAVVAGVYPSEMPSALAQAYGAYDRDWNAFEREEVQILLDEAKPHVSPDVSTTFEPVASTSSANGLATLAKRTGAGLVVLGSHRHTQERHTLPGSTGERILHGSPWPVAIVPRRYHDTVVDEPFRTVTVAYIDTPDGHEALTWAAGLAERTGAELRAVTVIDKPSDRYLRKAEETASEFAAKAGESSLKTAQAAVGALPHSIRRTVMVLAGPVVDVLATLGLERPDLATDVLVVGSRGYGPVRRTLLGGVSHHLVLHTRVPLIVVPRGHHEHG